MKISLHIFSVHENEDQFQQLPASDLKKLDTELAVNEWLFFTYTGGCEIITIAEENKKPLTTAELQECIAQIAPQFSHCLKNTRELHSETAIIQLLKNIAGLHEDRSGRLLLEPIRDAFELAIEEGFAGPILHYLFQKGIWLHEKIRMESSYYKFAVNPATVLRELAGKIFGSVKNKCIHFIGWHEDFQKVVTELSAAGAQDFLLHCTKPRFVHPKIRQSNTPPSKINGQLETADMILIGELDSDFQLQKSAIARRMTAQNNARLLICNYSTNEKIIKNVKRIYNVFSYEKAELTHLIKHNTNSRDAVLPDITTWFEHESKEFFRWLESDKRYSFAGMVGASREMQRIFELISRVARTNVTILIDGESGTGKELVARAVHNLSSRSERQFVAVNCGAIPDALLESELFGHEKGAFTGADYAKAGLIETAEGGTILLDEIAELQPHLQVKLLRFLQEGETKRVGGTETRHPNVRVLAATNKNLSDLVEAGTFRSDLYYRLNVLQLTLPPLRERGKDVVLIANYFLKRINKSFQKEVQEFSSEALQALIEYTWPGNVRELENAVERACALAVGSKIAIFDLPPALQNQKQDSGRPTATEVSLTLKDMERQHILSVLDHYDWNYEEASKALAIGRTTLWRKLREYGVEQKP